MHITLWLFQSPHSTQTFIAIFWLLNAVCSRCLLSFCTNKMKILGSCLPIWSSSNVAPPMFIGGLATAYSQTEESLSVCSHGVWWVWDLLGLSWLWTKVELGQGKSWQSDAMWMLQCIHMEWLFLLPRVQWWSNYVALHVCDQLEIIMLSQCALLVLCQ